MDETTDNVKTIVHKDLSGYIKKSRLEAFLEELLGKKINVSMSNDRFWFYASRKVDPSELKGLREASRVN